MPSQHHASRDSFASATRQKGRWLLLALFFFHSLIPFGYMPDAHAEGGMQLVICTGTGPMQITLDANGEPVETSQDTADHDQHGPCPYGLSSHSLPTFVAVLPVFDTTQAGVALPPQQHPALAVLYKTAPPRAPPALS